MKLRMQDALLEMFENAQILDLDDENSTDQLTDQELFYSKNQIEAGFQIRFDALHIYSRMSGQSVISILRSNLNME